VNRLLTRTTNSLRIKKAQIKEKKQKSLRIVKGTKNNKQEKP
jgi:hypothetical protein